MKRQLFSRTFKYGENSAALQHFSRACQYSIITAVEAHLTLAALLRSSLRVPGINAAGEWPEAAKRLASLAEAISERIRLAGCAGATYSLADDDVMLLCQGAEVLGAAEDGASVFFEGTSRREFFCVGRGRSGAVVLDAKALLGCFECPGRLPLDCCHACFKSADELDRHVPLVYCTFMGPSATCHHARRAVATKSLRRVPSDPIATLEAPPSPPSPLRPLTKASNK